MSSGVQIFTLIGVTLGALLSYFARSLGDRSRFRHDHANRWEERKLDAYIQFANDVKDLALLSRRIAGARGLQSDEPSLDLDKGLPLLDEAENRRELSTERVYMLAGRETALAYRRLNLAAGRLEQIAHGRPPDVTASEWTQAVDEYERVFDLFTFAPELSLVFPANISAGPSE
jgi:hypothetical protein